MKKIKITEKTAILNHLGDCYLLKDLQVEKIIVKCTTGVQKTLNFALLHRFHKLKEIQIDCPGNIYSSNNMLFYRSDRELLLVFALGTEKDVVVPDGVNIIGVGAFESTNIQSVILPDTVARISDQAFANCGYLSEVKFPESLKVIGEDAFRGCKSLRKVIFPESVKQIRCEAFYGCVSLTDVTFPSKLKKIDSYTFAYCSSLKNIELPEQLQRIERNAFYNCESLESIDVPESVKEIGDLAFYNCGSLKHIFLYEGLQNIGNYAFYSCGVKEISLPGTIQYLGGNSLGNIRDIHVKGFIPGLVGAVTDSNDSFCIQFGETRLIFPGIMTYAAKKEAESIYKKAVQEPNQKVYNPFYLGSTACSKHMAALNAYRFSKDDNLKKYLKLNEAKFLEYIDSEEEMMDLLNVFQEIGLTDSMVKKGLALSEERDWICATAYLLQQSEKTKKSTFLL